MTTENLDIAIRQTGAQQAAKAVKDIGAAAQGAGRNVGAAAAQVQALGGKGAAVRPVTAQLKELGAAAQRSKAEVSGLGSSLGALASAASAVAAAFGAIRLADEFSRAQSQLRLITKSEAELGALSEAVFRQAQETRVEYGVQAAFVTRITNSTQELGASQEEVLSAAKAVAQSFSISGTSASEAAASAQQLGQALGSGVLAGDELRSILENNSSLAQAIADGLGVGRNQLKQMGADGKLLSEDVFKAILSQTDEIGAKFAKITPTISQGGTVFLNSLTAAVGRLNEASGAGAALVGFLTKAADQLDRISGSRSLTDKSAEALGQTEGNIRKLIQQQKFLTESQRADPSNSFYRDRLVEIGKLIAAQRSLRVIQQGALSNAEGLSASARAAAEAKNPKRPPIASTSAVSAAVPQAKADATARLAALEAAQDKLKAAAEKREAARLAAIEAQADAYAKVTDASKSYYEASLNDVQRLQAKLVEVQALIAAGGFQGLPQGSAGRVVGLLKIELEQAKNEANGTASAVERVDQLLASAVTPAEQLKKQFVEIQRLENAGLISPEKAARAFDIIGAQLDELSGTGQDQLKTMEELATQIGTNLEDLFSSILDGFDGSIESAKNVISQFLRQLAAQASAQKGANLLQDFIVGAVSAYTGVNVGGLAKATGASATGGDAKGGSSTPGTTKGGSVGGFKALGGPVDAGKTYLVGETGPEKFTAPTNGRIDSAAETAKQNAGGSVVVINEQNPAALIASLDTAEGTRVIRNMITANRDDFKRILGVS